MITGEKGRAEDALEATSGAYSYELYGTGPFHLHVITMSHVSCPLVVAHLALMRRLIAV